MIFIAGISIGLFISALLMVKKQKSKSDIILLIWMLLNTAHLSFFYAFISETIYDYPHFLGIQFPFALLHGVLLFYYVSTVTNQPPQHKYTVFFHLIPTLIVYLYLIPFFSKSAAEKISAFKSGGADYITFQKVLLFAVFLSGVIYVLWSNHILQKHRQRIRNEFSSLEEINLKWLQFLIYGLGTVWALIIFTQNDMLIFMAVSVFVILIGFFGIQQKNIFGSNLPLTTKQANTDHTPILPKEKYSNSGLSEEQEVLYYDKLSNLVVDEKIYTNPNLSLSDLALKLDIHQNYLSQIINKKEGKTFYDFINAYRIEEFKRLIAIPKNQQFTLVAIAYDCGFNSKSSFNRYFKKITGLTPSQYVTNLKS